MNKIILTINGMKCGMCEAHVNDLFRKNIRFKSIKSDHKKSQTVIISEEDYTSDELNRCLDGSGYIIENISKETAQKTLLGWK